MDVCCYVFAKWDTINYIEQPGRAVRNSYCDQKCMLAVFSWWALWAERVMEGPSLIHSDLKKSLLGQTG